MKHSKDVLKLVASGHNEVFILKSDYVSQLKDCPPAFGEAILKNCGTQITLAGKLQQKTKGDSHD